MYCSRHFSLAAALLLLTLPGFCASAAQPAPEEAAIAKLVQESQKAGKEKRDLAKWLAPWAKDAKIIIGRSEKPNMYDVVWTWSHIKFDAEVWCSGKPIVPPRLTFGNMEVQITGDQAVLHHRCQLDYGFGVLTTDEIYRLRKTGAGWKIYENRWWPVSVVSRVLETRYDAQKWSELDATVEKVREKKDLSGLEYALTVAWRDSEAHTVSKQVTKEQPNDVNAWVFRGEAAWKAGDTKDTLDSYRQALVLDPNADVPDPIRSMLKKN